MKKINKLLALIVALSIILAMTLTAAAASTGQITITAPQNISLDDVTFNAYRIFDLSIKENESADDEYVYTINTSFASFVFSYDGTAYSGESLREYLSGLEKVDHYIKDAAVIEALTSQVKSFIVNTTPAIAPAGTGTRAEGSYVINGLAPGYYVVIPDGNLAALPILTMLTVDDENKPVVLKADAPTIDKKVHDGTTWGDVADYNIGDTVPFRHMSKVPNMAGYDSYIFTVHDTMSAGLSFDDNVTVMVGDESFPYFDVIDDNLGDDCTFHIVFDPDKFIGLTPGDAIEILYTAILNEDAAIASPGNPNEVYLEYSNNPYEESDTGTTPEDKVIVYTFEFEVVKVNGVGERLSGAEFVLYREINDEIEYAVIVNNKIFDWTLTKASAVFTVNEAFTITGLDAGMYYLEETQAPAGYNLLDEAVNIVITPEYGTNNPPQLLSVTVGYGESLLPATDGADANTIVEIVILNNSGTIFPETGGIGTTIFTIVGICLMAGAAVVLIAKKKISNRN